MLSGLEQYQYIKNNINVKHIKDNISIIKKLPMLIRNDGLWETLNYICDKNYGCIFEIFIDIILDYGDKELNKDDYNVDDKQEKIIDKLKNIRDTESYMWLEKYVYEFSIKITSIALAMQYEKSNDLKKYDKYASFCSDNKDINKNKSKSKSKSRDIEEKYKNTLKSEVTQYLSEKSKKYKILYNNKIECDYKVKLTSNLAIGLGEASVDGVSINFHNIYKVPFIPASSIKGAFRCYIKEKYDDSVNLTKIFGNQEKEGKLIILDSYPTEYSIKADIMNQHYKSYYNDGNVLGSTDDPTPILFPVVIKESQFKFLMFSDKDTYMINGEQTINIKDEFKNFLNEGCLGAKSSVGYGRMEVVANV